MELMTHLFDEYRTIAVVTAIIVLIVTLLPFTGRRFPVLLVRLVAAPIRILTTPFRYWRKTVMALATKAQKPESETGHGRSHLTRQLLPVMQGALVLGGILILTAGILSGLRASGVRGDDGRREANIGMELQVLGRALEDTRLRIEAADREWASAVSRWDEAHRQRYLAPIDSMEEENARLEQFLSLDPRTKMVFSDFRDAPAGTIPTADVLLTLESAIPGRSLGEGRRRLFLRYFENCRAQEELAAAFSAPRGTPARDIFQPDYRSLLALADELPTAIARVEAHLNAAKGGMSFDPAGFLRGFYPSVIMFCAFIWAMGYLIEIVGVILSPKAGGPGRKRGGRPAVDDTGTLIWAD